MFSIDLTNLSYYIIYKDDKEFCKVSRSNDLEFIIKYFNVQTIRGW